MALLELKGVDALYGRIRALREVTISVDQGEVVALIGSNGAGKTTTLRTISGLMHPPSGTITFDGKDISRLPAHEIVGLGICQSPEGRRLFPRMQVIDNLRMGAFLRNDAAGIHKDMERVFELLHRTPAIHNSGGRVLSRVQGKVEFRGVSFAYPTRKDVPVLTNFNLTLQPGEVVAIVGPSGAGKSTIASMLYRLYDPASGEVRLDDVAYGTLDPEWLRRQVGVVAQEPLLFSTSIAENIRYGRPEATDTDVEAAAKTANAHHFISTFPEKYQTLVGERGIQLSGGQKQRVAIARAVLKNPRILILDEATSALDAESEHLVREALERLMQGRTTLVIAHRLSTVKDANRVVVLEHGSVVQAGTHASLVAEEGLYRRLVERQFAA